MAKLNRNGKYSPAMVWLEKIIHFLNLWNRIIYFYVQITPKPNGKKTEILSSYAQPPPPPLEADGSVLFLVLSQYSGRGVSIHWCIRLSEAHFLAGGDWNNLFCVNKIVSLKSIGVVINCKDDTHTKLPLSFFSMSAYFFSSDPVSVSLSMSVSVCLPIC